MKHAVAVVFLVAGSCTFDVKTCTPATAETVCGVGNICVDGLCARGDAAGGSAVAGGSAAGGSVAGGSTAGGTVAGGSTAGGSTAGGSTAGGSVAGGSTAGGSVAGGSTAGGSTAGGTVAGGSAGAGTACPCFVVGQRCALNQCVNGVLRIMLTVPTTPIGQSPVAVSGVVIPDTDEVLPVVVSLSSTELDVPGSANVGSTGAFTFMVSGRQGQLGNKALSVRIDTGAGPISQTFQLPVATPHLFEFGRIVGSPLRNSAWAFGGVTEQTPRVDDFIEVRVRGDGAASAAVTFRGTGSFTNSCSSGCGANCGCFVLSTLGLPFTDLTSGFAVDVAIDAGASVVGAVMADGGAPSVTVTRLLWQRTFQGSDAGSPSAPLTPPVIGQDGVVTLGGDGRATDALTQWTFSGAPVARAFPATGQVVSMALDPGVSLNDLDDVLYVVARQGPANSLFAFFSDGGSVSRPLPGPVRVTLALAPTDGGAGPLGAIVHVSAPGDGGQGGLLHYTPGFSGDPVPMSDDRLAPQPPVAGVNPLENLVVTRASEQDFSNVFVLGRASNASTLVRRTLATQNAFVEEDGGASFASTATRGLAPLDLPDAGAPRLAVVTNGNLYIPPSPSSLGAATYPPRVDRFGNVWVSSAGALTVYQADGGVDVVGVGNLSPVFVTQSRPPMTSFSAAYLVSGNRLLQITPGPVPSVTLSAQLPFTMQELANIPPLAVDCSRFTALGQNVVLYIASPRALTAVLVPGFSVDPLAAWPRWQFDQFHSGNPSLRLPTGCR